MGSSTFRIIISAETGTRGRERARRERPPLGRAPGAPSSCPRQTDRQTEGREGGRKTGEKRTRAGGLSQKESPMNQARGRAKQRDRFAWTLASCLPGLGHFLFLHGPKARGLFSLERWVVCKDKRDIPAQLAGCFRGSNEGHKLLQALGTGDPPKSNRSRFSLGTFSPLAGHSSMLWSTWCYLTMVDLKGHAG